MHSTTPSTTQPCLSPTQALSPLPGRRFSFENLATADSALVIDLTNMRAVRVDAGAMTATVQAGIRMGNLYYEIFKAGGAAGGRNLTCMGGTYPQVTTCPRPSALPG